MPRRLGVSSGEFNFLHSRRFWAVNRGGRSLVVSAENELPERDYAMPTLTSSKHRILSGIAVSTLALSMTVAAGQTRPPAQPRPPVAPVASEKDLSATQEQLIKLLRESPTLTTVVEHDPSLLANQEYVRRNNPHLAQFLDSHPEIALNPDYYLFTHLNGDGEPSQALERAV